MGIHLIHGREPHSWAYIFYMSVHLSMDVHLSHRLAPYIGVDLKMRAYKMHACK
jgi:hypothetical protein